MLAEKRHTCKSFQSMDTRIERFHYGTRIVGDALLAGLLRVSPDNAHDEDHSVVTRPTPSRSTVVPNFLPVAPASSRPPTRRAVMWTPVASPPEAKVPSSRSKHASVLYGQNMYLLGGRNGNVPLKDFWKYSIADNKWEPIPRSGDPPGCLQEHTMVGYRDTIYVFGGEVGFSNGVETPLWMFDIKGSTWRKFAAPKGVVTPKGRRSHTATVFQDSMYIYGGYQDLKGSTSELWAFHFTSETWHLVSQGGAVDGPPPRHRHTAVLHDSAVWIFGGMTDLQERSDFWRFDFVSRRWRPVKSKPGPGCLNSHCAVKFLSVMMLFGGERDGQILNEMWRFHFATEFWERLQFPSSQPMPRAQTTAFIFSQFRTRGTVHYMGLPEQDYLGTKPDPSSQTEVPYPTQAESNVAETSFRQKGLTEVGQLNARGDQSKKFSFAPVDSCAVEEVTSTVESLPREILRDLRRPSHFQRLDQQDGNILKDLAKISQVNLSRLSNYCSYSMFSNESTESLNTASSTASPCSVRMAKSRSSQLMLNMAIQEAHLSDGSGDVTPQGDRPSTGIVSRDTISVPNFKTLQEAMSLEEDSEMHERENCILKKATKAIASCPSPGEKEEKVEEIEFAPGTVDEDGISLAAFNSKLVLLEDEGETADKVVKQVQAVVHRSSHSPPIEALIGEKGPSRSDSEYTFQSYDCSSRSSTASSRETSSNTPPSHHGAKLAKSSSIQNRIAGFFNGEVKLIDLEEEEAANFYSSDEFSSLSGYESIEAVNDVEGDDIAKPDDTLSRLSFANPNYLAPDVQEMVERKKMTRAQFVARESESNHSLAQALNSPADSLFSDFQDFHSRLNKDLSTFELDSFSSREASVRNGSQVGKQRPKSAFLNPGLRTSDEDLDTISTDSRVSSATTVPVTIKRQRPLSAEIRRPESQVSPVGSCDSMGRPVRPPGMDPNHNQLNLLMYIIGGREVGQVTVFRRPISIWKLDLTKTF